MSDNSIYDAILVVSFGGPDGPDDVIPFLENVLRGKNMPRQRMLEVAEHYHHLGSASPINEHVRQLVTALETELREHDIDLPVYSGNRNWHPMLPDTLQKMKQDGIRKALAFFTSAYSSYSGCRQYRENLDDARTDVGEGAPQVDRLRMFFNHPLFIEASANRVRDGLANVDEPQRPKARIVFTAHSIPITMADGCLYREQLNQTCRLIMNVVGEYEWDLVYQSRSGPPTQPWLEPDICDYLEQLKHESNVQDVVVMPVGFLSDHMEVLFDLDTEAQETCRRNGLNMHRAKSVGIHPKFISMIRQLITERTAGTERLAIGSMPPHHDACPKDCCPLET